MFDDKEFDHDDGTPVFELEFTANGNEYEYDIHAVTGKVVKAEHKTPARMRNPATGSGSTNYNDTDYGPNNDGVTDYNDTDYGPNNDGVTDYNDTDYGPNNDGVTDYNDTDYGPNNDGVTDYNDTDYGPNNDGVTDYNDTDYGPNNDGVTDYNDTDYGPNNDGVTDYNDTDYGPNNDGVTDYNDTDYGPNNDGVTDYSGAPLRRYQLRRRRQRLQLTMTTMGIPIMTTKPRRAIPLRHELKHQINLREDLVLSQRLKKLFPHDKNAGPDGTYRVTSLYFDTPYDSALREKIDGVNRREKFRLRYYGADTSFIRLEKKYKIERPVRQAQRPDDAEQVQRLLSGSYEFLLDSGEPLFIELYSKIKGKGLRPKTIVRYDREAFLYAPGNVRITLDRDIRTGLGNVDFLNPDIFYLRAMEPARCWKSNTMRFCRSLSAWRCRCPEGRRRPAPNTPYAGGLIKDNRGGRAE